MSRSPITRGSDLHDTNALLRESSHRPWALPRAPWVMFQSWQEQLFMHWPVRREMLRELVPKELELDTYHGTAYVGVTPFLLSDLRVRMLPPLPGVSRFLETNLRTYVNVGGKPGVFFFSLDAASRLAVAGARASFHLPYFFADMKSQRQAEWIRYRTSRRKESAELVVRYRPTGDAFLAAPGTIDHFLIERYALYVVHRGRVIRGDIHHRQWNLRPAAATIEVNTIPRAHHIELPAIDPLLHYSARQDTLIWLPSVV